MAREVYTRLLSPALLERVAVPAPGQMIRPAVFERFASPLLSAR